MGFLIKINVLSILSQLVVLRAILDQRLVSCTISFNHICLISFVLHK